MSENEIIIAERPKVLSLGALPTTGPVALIKQASGIATELAKIIKDKKLSSRIQGREFVHVEGWSTMGAMLGVLPREVPNGVHRLEDGSYEATVELIRINDGAIIGRASALCGMDEKDRKGNLTWGNRAEYARRSMAVTRATGKAFRLGFSWIMAMAGYEPTPREEIVDGAFENPKPTKKAARKAPAKKASQKKPPAVKPDPATPWTQDTNVLKGFWAWAGKRKVNDKPLTNPQVHEALNVERLMEFTGNLGTAKSLIDAWVAGQSGDGAK